MDEKIDRSNLAALSVDRQNWLPACTFVRQQTSNSFVEIDGSVNAWAMRSRQLQQDYERTGDENCRIEREILVCAYGMCLRAAGDACEVANLWIAGNAAGVELNKGERALHRAAIAVAFGRTSKLSSSLRTRFGKALNGAMIRSLTLEEFRDVLSPGQSRSGGVKSLARISDQFNKKSKTLRVPKTQAALFFTPEISQKFSVAEAYAREQRQDVVHVVLLRIQPQGIFEVEEYLRPHAATSGNARL